MICTQKKLTIDRGAELRTPARAVACECRITRRTPSCAAHDRTPARAVQTQRARKDKMSGHISDEDIQKVRDATDLVALVSEITPVQQRGGEVKCLCPFHTEKTPSFHIDPQRQLWHCFGCGEGGDLFKFVCKSQNVTFPEAVRMLADRAHIELKEEATPAARANKSKRARLMDVCEKTCEFYHSKLMRERSDDAARAREYLSARNLGGQIPKTWALGFAPGRAQLVRHLYSAGFTYDEMMLANVAVKGRDGKIHDRFFNRVMFPIRDVSGRVIAFGGRVIGEGEPKYLNSQETPLFHKSEVLYGLDMAKAGMAASGVAVVVEGYTDVIACHAAGLNNVVATLGTALTQKHIRTLSRHAKNEIVYLFDGDAAGQRAADRALGFIDSSITPEGSKNPISLKAVTLPDNQDPAEFLETHGADELRETIAGAKQLIQYGIDRRLAQNDLTTPEGRSMAFSQALQILAPIKTSVLAQQYMVVIANATHVSEVTALDALKKLKPTFEQSRQVAQGAAGAGARGARGAGAQNSRAGGAQGAGGARGAGAQGVHAGANGSVQGAGAVAGAGGSAHADAVAQGEQPSQTPAQHAVQTPMQMPDLKNNRSQVERSLLSLCVHEPGVAAARLGKVSAINFHEALHVALSNALLNELTANAQITPAALLSNICMKVPAAGAYLTYPQYDTTVSAEKMADYLCEELQIMDMEETINAMRAQAASQKDSDEFFRMIVGMQRDLKKRKSAHKPL